MLTALDRETARRFYMYLRECEYASSDRLARLGLQGPRLPHLRNLPRSLAQTSEPTPLNVLIRLFCIGLTIPEESARETLPGWLVDAALESGLLRRDREGLVPEAVLTPIGEAVVASGPNRDLLRPDCPEHILDISPATRYLTRSFVLRPVRRTLDLGAGNGILSLACAPFSDEVVATDLNPRAEHYVRFNARLNGFTNIRAVTGDLFEPVAGERFDRIVSTPPLRLGPSEHILWADGDMELDGFAQRIFREAPAHLAEGGLFQTISEWVQLRGVPWKERVSSWFAGSGCDVLVLHDYHQRPETYTDGKLKETPYHGPDADQAFFDRWMAFFEERDVEAMHGGFVIMRRRSGDNWIHIQDLPLEIDGAFGDLVAGLFESRDVLEGDDASLLGRKIGLSPQVRAVREHRPQDGTWVDESLRLTLAGPVPGKLEVQGDLLSFLTHFDGNAPLSEIVSRAAAAAGADRAEVERDCLKAVRQLLATGFLVPAPEDRP